MALLSPQLRKQYHPRTPQGRQVLRAKGLDLIRNVLLVLFVLRLTRKTLLQLRGYGLVGSVQQLYSNVYRRLYALFLRLPFVQVKVQADVQKAITELQSKLVPSGPGVINYTVLPAQGWTSDQVRGELERLGEMDHTRWEDGRVSGAVYHGGSELAELQSDAFKRFGVSNPIHP